MKIIYEFDMTLSDYPSLRGFEIEAKSIDELLSNGYYPDPVQRKEDNIYYALKGDYRDYLAYCKMKFEGQVTREVLDHFGYGPYNGSKEEWEEYHEKVEREYKPWYINKK